MNRTRILLDGSALLLAAALFACSDAVEPYRPPATEWPETSDGLRLTYSTGSDRGPTWSLDGDSIYYIASAHSDLPESPGLLVALPAKGGVSRAIIANRQLRLPQPRWLTTANISPKGDRIAYVDLTNGIAPVPEGTTACTTPAAASSLNYPILMNATLRVTSTEPTVTDNDVRVAIVFEGRGFDATPVPQYGLPGTWILTAYPFQQRFAGGTAPVFRPSWAPDGNRLVFSDGLQLLTWVVGNTPSPVPNTQDAMFPSWSPDGQWIAFTQAVRTGSTVADCTVAGSRGAVNEVQRRTIVNVDGTNGGVIRVIRPDGTGLRTLGPGDTPVWTPDGRVVFRRDNALWRMNADGTNASPIDKTTGGTEPSVSPDGSHIAFVRDRDVWVVPLGN